MKIKKLLMSMVVAGTFFTTAISTFASGFPQIFEHKLGTTIIEKKPLRIVSIGWAGVDNLLSVGVKPIAFRNEEKDVQYVPWEKDKWGGEKPVFIGRELDFEQILSLKPDLILSLYSRISEEEYALLSGIAPTIAVESQYSDYATPWDVRARTTARAVGELEKAEVQIAAINKKISDIAKAHPEWRGKTTTVAGYGSGYGVGAVRSPDIRAQLLAQLGLVVPSKINDLGRDGGFWATLSTEDLSPLDVDVLIWRSNSADETEVIKGFVLRKKLNAHKEGREIMLQGLTYGALYSNSLSSIPYFLDRLVPQVELAIDGDPSTIVPSTKASGLLD